MSGRAQILEIAKEEFAAHGFAGTTTAQIARRAGVTQPLVHHHFGSKAELFRAVLEVLFGTLRDALNEAESRAKSLPTRERVVHLLHSFVCFSGEHPALSRLLRTESSAGGTEFEMVFATWLEPLTRFFQKEITTCVDEKIFRPIDSRLAYFAIIGIATQPFAEPETAKLAFGLDTKNHEDIVRYADFVVRFVFEGLGHPALREEGKA